MGLGHLMSFLKMFPSPLLKAWTVPSLPGSGVGAHGDPGLPATPYKEVTRWPTVF